jgi:hypothetical protein
MVSFSIFVQNTKVIDFQGISNRTIMAIDSIEPFRFWIAGTRGSIYRTTNSGEDWWAVCSSEEVFIDDLESVYLAAASVDSSVGEMERYFVQKMVENPGSFA